LLATHLALPYWLSEAVSEQTLVALQNRTAPLFSLLVVIVVGTTVYSLRESLDLPVAPQQNIRAARQKRKAKKGGDSKFARLFRRSPRLSRRQKNGLNHQSATEDHSQLRQPVRVPHYSELPEWEPPKDDSGLIMLEID
jgi:hypothetical protein